MKNAVIAVLVAAFVAEGSPTQRVSSLVASPDAPASQSIRLTFDTSSNSGLFLGAIAVDAGGNIYLTGGTKMSRLPALNPEMPKHLSRMNAFVMKFDPNGRPVWSSFIGGSTERFAQTGDPGGDHALAIAVDPSGQVVIAGRTFSTDFPTVNAFQGVAQATRLFEADGFVAKLSSDGKRLIYSSYFGGRTGDSRLSGLAVGPAGEVWVAGSSRANDISTQFNVSDRDSNQAIVLKLNPMGSVIWSTRMSGTEVYDIAVDALGQAHVAAGCPVATLPCSSFVAKLSSSGSQQMYRERVGDGSSAVRVSLNANGEAVVSGVSGVSQPVNPWPSGWEVTGSGFVRLLDASGRTLSSNGVNGSAYTAIGERMIVAFNTSARGLPTSRALITNHVDGPFYVSDDGAATWTNIGGPQTATSIQFDPDRDQLFAVSAASSSRSDDGGRTWVADTASPYFAIDPRHPNIHWRSASTNRGPLSRRADGGAWQPVGPATGPSPNNGVTTLAVSPHDGSAWVGGDFGAEVIADSGSYRFENDGFPLAVSPGTRGFAVPTAFVFDARDPGVVYAATRAGLYGRSGSSASWVPLTGGLPSQAFYDQQVLIAAVDPADSNVLLIGRTVDGLYRSGDRGRSWQRVVSGTGIPAIVWDPNRPGVVYASGDRVYRSIDHGVTWQPASFGYESRSAPSAIGIDPRTSRLYASSGFVNPMGFAMAVVGAGTTATRPWATYLKDGTIFDVATTPSGEAVVAQVVRGVNESEVTLVRIGR